MRETIPKNNPEFEAEVCFKILVTPLGEMLAVSDGKGICLLEFPEKLKLEKELIDIAKTLKANFVERDSEELLLLDKELLEYFQGERKMFTVPLSFVGTTFQKSVWNTLLKIPYGSTWSYAQQTKDLGDMKKIRAVANANGQNKISILVPCHRVIGSNGKLVGYSGGVWRKQKLLELEKAIIL